MIKVINSKDLKTNVDLVCTYCGKEHTKRNLEGIDFVFETDIISKEEWCICIECQRECNK